MQREKTLEDYDLIKEVGTGSYGKVYQAMRKSDGEVIALKVIELYGVNNRLIEATKKEVEYLNRLSVPSCNRFIICYYDSYHDVKNGKFLIEMEYIDGKDLHKYLDQARADGVPEEELYNILLLIVKDVAEGLKYIHSRGVIHNDIKLENIMIDKNNVPRIIDFGLSCFSKPDRERNGVYCRARGASGYYVPPEYVTPSKRYPESDLWALGVMIFRAVYNRFPIGSTKDTWQTMMARVQVDAIPKLASSNIKLNTIVDNLLVRDVNARWTPDQVIQEIEGGDAGNPENATNIKQANAPVISSFQKALIIQSIRSVFMHSDFFALNGPGKIAKLNTIINSKLVHDSGVTRDEVISIYSRIWGTSNLP